MNSPSSRPRDPDERPDQHAVDLLGEKKQKMKAMPKPSSALISPRAQLDQVIHQWRFAGLDIFGAHDALAS